MTDIMQEKDFYEHQHMFDKVARPFKRTKTGCLIVADSSTPAADQRYGYVLVAIEVES